MKNFKKAAEETVEVVIPAVKSAGEYVYVIGKKAKTGFSNNKKKISDFLSRKDTKNNIFKGLCIVLLILSLISLAIEICDLISVMRSRKAQDDTEK